MIAQILNEDLQIDRYFGRVFWNTDLNKVMKTFGVSGFCRKFDLSTKANDTSISDSGTESIYLMDRKPGLFTFFNQTSLPDKGRIYTCFVLTSFFYKIFNNNYEVALPSCVMYEYREEFGTWICSYHDRMASNGIILRNEESIRFAARASSVARNSFLKMAKTFHGGKPFNQFKVYSEFVNMLKAKNVFNVPEEFASKY